MIHWRTGHGRGETINLSRCQIHSDKTLLCVLLLSCRCVSSYNPIGGEGIGYGNKMQWIFRETVFRGVRFDESLNGSVLSYSNVLTVGKKNQNPRPQCKTIKAIVVDYKRGEGGGTKKSNEIFRDSRTF